MKKKLVVALMLVFMLALTGCIDMRYGVELEKDGSGKVYAIAGMDKEMLEDPSSGMQDAQPGELLGDVSGKEGVTVQDKYEYTKDGVTYSGVRAEIAFKNLDELDEKFGTVASNDQGEQPLDLTGMVTVDKGLLKTTWIINIDTSGFVVDEETKEMLDFMKMHFELKLPGELLETNADVQTGNLLEWDMQNFGKGGKNVEAKVVFYNTGATVGLIGGIILLVVVLAIVLMRRNKQAPVQEVVTVTYSATSEDGETVATDSSTPVGEPEVTAEEAPAPVETPVEEPETIEETEPPTEVSEAIEEAETPTEEEAAKVSENESGPETASEEQPKQEPPSNN